MLKLKNYRITEKIREGKTGIIYRGFTNSDNTPVIIKRAYEDHNFHRHASILKREYQIVKKINAPGVMRIHELVSTPESCALISEEVKGITLRQYLQENQPDLNTALKIGIRLFDSLSNIHRNLIVHKDINPGNLIIDPTEHVITIIDFDIATELLREENVSGPAESLEGTLAYISPEQTGRLNLPLDYRTDIYSAGITFYRTLVGRLPFQATDPVGWVHAHIALEPPPPSRFQSGLPGIIEEIQLKIIAKSPEARYQSARGIARDLRKCLRLLNESGKIEPFALGQNDIFERFLLPDKLYGREAELGELLETFERVARTGEPALTLVSGYSGIGKSSLVGEIQPAIAELQGYYLAGKYEQLRRDIPYLALGQALGNLLEQLSGQSEKNLRESRDNILRTLGENGALLLELIPELELITGPLPEVPLRPTQEKARVFNQTLIKFLGIFAGPTHPLVIFLDDLQWADNASLELIKTILTDADNLPLLLIGAYRNNEVDQNHPLTGIVELIRDTGRPIRSIHVGPLKEAELVRMTADSLRHKALETALPLAKLLEEKTAGNPFFVKQFFQTLYREDLLYLNHEEQRWTYEIDRIKKRSISNNVIELMLLRLGRFSEETREALARGACIGAKFDLLTLAIVLKVSPREALARLWPALQDGLLSAHSKSPHFRNSPSEDIEINNLDARNAKVCFIHDRVQQAAYELSHPDKLPGVHLEIGRLLLKESSEEAAKDERLFEILRHFNGGHELIADQSERLEVARLNLRAARRAKLAAAFEIAKNFPQAGIRLLPPGHREELYDLSYALYFEQAECELLTGNLKRAEELFNNLITWSRGSDDRGRVYYQKMYTLFLGTRFQEVIDTGLEALSLFDIKLTQTPALPGIILNLLIVRRKFKKLTADQSLNLPLQTDPAQTLIRKLLFLLHTAAFVGPAKNLAALLICILIKLSIKEGITADSAYSFGFLSTMTIAFLGDYRQGKRSADLSLKISERFNDSLSRGRTLFIFGATCDPWYNHMGQSLPDLEEAFTLSSYHGDYIYAGYDIIFIIRRNLLMGVPLEKIIKKYQDRLSYLDRNNSYETAGAGHMLLGFAYNLRGETRGPSSLTWGKFDEERYIARLKADKLDIMLCWYYPLKGQSLYLKGALREALEILSTSDKIIHFVLPGNIVIVENCHWLALTLAALCDSAPAWERLILRRRLSKCARRMQSWAKIGPENFQHKYLLIMGEISRLKGQFEKATDYYGRAAESARAGGFLQHQAVANELAARLAWRQGRAFIAGAFLREAQRLYTIWGAHTKLKILDEAFTDLPRRATATRENTSLSGNDSMSLRERNVQTDKNSESASTADTRIDLDSVIKATRSISSELKQERLLGTLMRIMLENAGAQRGALFLTEKTEPVLMNRLDISEGNTGQEKPEAKTLLKDLEKNAESDPDLWPATSVVRFVTRKQTELLLDDASLDERFSRDPYIKRHKPRSILCAPIIHKSRLRAILYLENNLAAGSFTDRRLETLSMLTAQAAISLENVQMYEQTEKLNFSLQKEVEERKRAEAEVRILNVDLEERVRRRTAELEIANKELESFSYSVSHDLRAPLRHIDGYSQILEEDAASKLDESEQKSLLKIRAGVGRMNELIEDMLKLARVTRSEINLEKINLSVMAGEIVRNLQDTEPGRDIEIHIADNLIARCDGRLIRNVLENLLGNAWKYTSKNPPERQPARVLFQQNPEGAVGEFMIQDNGAGFDMKYADKLFGTFQRLHKNEEFEGTGVGLATVRRIILRHGGQIRAQAEPQKGATFYFTLSPWIK